MNFKSTVFHHRNEYFKLPKLETVRNQTLVYVPNDMTTMYKINNSQNATYDPCHKVLGTSKNTIA